VYIGTQPAIGQNRKLDSLAASFNGAASTFNLTINTSPIVPSNVYQLFISLGGVLQNPGVDFTVSGNQITFTTIPAAGLSFFGIFQGDSITGTPTIADASITTLKLATGLTVTHTAGTAGAPSVTFAGDTNTGIFNPAADTLAFAEGGVEVMRIDSSGRVGIGTGSPGAILHTTATSAGAATIGAFIQNSSLTAATEVRLGFAPNPNTVADNRYSWIGAVNSTGSNDSSLTFATTPGGTGATERMRITSAGHVGIGTTSPSQLLEVSSSAATTIKATSTETSGSSFARLFLAYTGSGGSNTQASFNVGSNYSLLGVTTSHPLIFTTSNTERARIDSSGRLLVGTSTSRSNAFGQAVHQVEGTNANAFSSVTIAENSAFGGAFVLAKSRGTAFQILSSGDNLGILSFQGADGSALREAARIDAQVDGTPGANDMPGRLVFSTTADGAASPTERMRITSGGIVNINGGKFQVNTNGDVDLSVTTNSNDNGFIFDTGDGGAGNRPKFRIRYGAADQIFLDGNGTAEKPGGGSWAAISDSRAKEEIIDYISGLDQLKQIQPRSYRYIGNENTYIGLVAQEVEDAMPELIRQGEGMLPDGTEVTDLRTLDQTPLTFALINAVKEMAEQIDLLKAKVAALEGE
jgi:hypothetical protein